MYHSLTGVSCFLPQSSSKYEIVFDNRNKSHKEEAYYIDYRLITYNECIARINIGFCLERKQNFTYSVQKYTLGLRAIANSNSIIELWPR